MTLHGLLVALGSIVAPALVTTVTIARAALAARRKRVWDREIATVHGLEKPNFYIIVSQTFVRPSRETIAVRPQIRVDRVEGNEASVQRFQAAVEQTNRELMTGQQPLTDIEVRELFTKRLSEQLGMDFLMPPPTLRLDWQTIRTALQSGGLSLLTRENWKGYELRRLPPRGGLGVLTRRASR